ncbi:hypothetical protein ABH922_000923 [Rhodococcus sp. 27YEA15]|uniref:wax ester/triacylglycerol synthase domain-containing protein n=1 Tax=Rhodococcus sp. 27YEA15 TaxID=3156259 RepID=UPI003C799B52
MRPTDAQTFWISEKIPNDQLLLYGFGDTRESVDDIRRTVLERAALIPDLRIRIRESPWHLDYPVWEPMTVDESLIVVHELAEPSWRSCIGSVEVLLESHLNPRTTPWTLHLFDGVTGTPRSDGRATIAVLQVSHSLADGKRASSIARALFSAGDLAPAEIDGRSSGALEILGRAALRLPGQMFSLFRDGRAGHRAQLQLQSDTESGIVAPQAPNRPRVVFNTPPGERRLVRMVVRDGSDLRGGGVSVTVAAMTAISVAMSNYLTVHDVPVPAELGAEVTIAKPGSPTARNHFRNAGVGLFPDISDLRERAARIEESMAERRARAAHHSGAASDRALDAVPGPLVRWGVQQYDFTAVPAEVTGNTVVSSVARGDADLVLGGGTVRFTAGFPSLSPVMSLTHGVHGIGDTVTIGITASPLSIPDVDVYEQMMHDAVDTVRDALV